MGDDVGEGEGAVGELVEELAFEDDTAALEIHLVFVDERRFAVRGVVVVGVDEIELKERVVF